jgi:hypothetical protein
MSFVYRTVNWIHVRQQQHRLVKHLLDETDAFYEDLKLHIEECWPIQVEVSFRFQKRLPEFVEFPQDKGGLPPQSQDSRWLLQLTFLTAKLHQLNTKLQFLSSSTPPFTTNNKTNPISVTNNYIIKTV